MQKTENYGLNLWDAEDAVVRTDFNADNEKIEAALTALQTAIGETAAEVAASMPRVKIGTYAGTSTYGKSNPVKLTFDFKPKFLMVWGYNTYIMLGIEGQTLKIHYDDGTIVQSGTTWGDNYVSWYYDSSGGFAQMNNGTSTYSYIAIG